MEKPTDKKSDVSEDEGAINDIRDGMCEVVAIRNGSIKGLTLSDIIMEKDEKNSPHEYLKTYIIFQMKIDSRDCDIIKMSAIVRKVKADCKEMAIGKFVEATKHIKAVQKLDVECYDLNELDLLVV